MSRWRLLVAVATLLGCQDVTQVFGPRSTGVLPTMADGGATQTIHVGLQGDQACYIVDGRMICAGAQFSANPDGTDRAVPVPWYVGDQGD